MRELSLSGGDISLIKCFGAGTTPISGKDLAKSSGMVAAELVDTLQGLVIQDLVQCAKPSFKTMQDIETVMFRLNSGRMKDIRTAIRPQARKSGRK
jgi:hypothetical protein